MLSKNPKTAQIQYREFMNIEPDITYIAEYQFNMELENESDISQEEKRIFQACPVTT
jgi:hypothetical protein